MYAKLRQKTNNDFEKDFFKLRKNHEKCEKA